MKQGNLVFKVIMIVLFVGSLAYFGVYLYNALTKNTETTNLYSYTAENSVQADGWFFRDESVVTDDNADNAEVVVSDGERIGKGDTVARVYASTESYQIQQQLDEAEAELTNLKYIQSRANEATNTMELDSDITDAFADLHFSVSTEGLSDMNDDINELKTLIFRRDYANTGTDTLSEEISAAQSKVDELTAQASSAYTSLTSAEAGMFAKGLDGYEGILTVDALTDLTPSKLENLVSQKQDAASNGVGKVVTSGSWYFACTVSESEAENLYKDLSVTLRFGDSGRTFPAKVKTVSDAEDGKVTVVFSSMKYVAQTVSMREQSVDIILSSITGFRVPKRAVRVDEDGNTGVYRVSGTQTEWVAVDVLWEEDDFYLIQQTVEYDEDGNKVAQSTFAQASALRAGDTVMVKGDSVYEGKVVTD
jgi:putative membrane fusion protein